MEEFIATAIIKRSPASSSFTVLVPMRIAAKLQLKAKQEAKVSLDGNRIIYEVIPSVVPT